MITAKSFKVKERFWRCHTYSRSSLATRVFTCLSSASFTAWLTWLRMSRQHFPAFLTFSLSLQSSAKKITWLITTLQRLPACVGWVATKQPSVVGRRALSAWKPTYRCIWLISPEAGDIWSAAASLWGWYPSAVSGGTGDCSGPPRGDKHHNRDINKMYKVMQVAQGLVEIKYSCPLWTCFIIITRLTWFCCL